MIIINKGDKKGALGLDTAKAVMVWFLVLAVLAIAIILALTSLRTSVEDVDKSTATRNETLTAVNSSAVTFLSRTASNTYRNAVCSGHQFYNATNATKSINSANYTLSSGNCGVQATLTSNYNLTNWNVSYSVTYSNPETNLIVGNVTGALTDNFFDQTGTIFAILIVVVIMFAIGLIIYVVTRFSAGGGMETKRGGYGSDTVMGI